jgi:ubiquitin-protein ligase
MELTMERRVVTFFIDLVLVLVFCTASITSAVDGNSQWSNLGNGLEMPCHDLRVSCDGTVYASFFSAGHADAASLSKWNGSSWSEVLSARYVGPIVFAVGPTGHVYAGGETFIKTGSKKHPTTNIAKWDGSAWSALGTGLGSGTHTQVDDMIVAPDGSIYAHGIYTTVTKTEGEKMKYIIAKWNGSIWATLGTNEVRTGHLALSPDGTLYTAIYEGNTCYVAKWNGSTWTALGTWKNGIIYSLVFAPDGTLYAGGSSGYSDNSGYVAKWNGSAWVALGSGKNGDVNALAVAPDGTLYAGRTFHHTEGVLKNYPFKGDVAKWNGSTWSTVGSEMDGNVDALAVAPDGTLYAGGSFHKAGGEEVNYIVKVTASK